MKSPSWPELWQRPPTESELTGLISDFIRQEIAYRESQAMQLDRDDIVIRRRLRQKLEMLTEDVASLKRYPPVPTGALDPYEPPYSME